MIRGERVNLRAVERQDASLIHAWFNDPEVMRGWGVPASTSSVALVQRQMEGWLDEEASLDRPVALIVETIDGDAAGLIVLSEYRPNPRSCELSILIGEPKRWGHGYGTDALRTVLDACFSEWNLHRVWVRSEAGNERAHRLYRRCGFHHEATLREAAFLDGQYEDVLIFSILEGEPIEPAET
ncbi:MAG: GNAT family N-acetyltransferase [Thermomicrobiales bacterium]